MANVTIKLNTAGVRQLLQSAEIAEAVEAQAQAIKTRCSGNYEINTQQGKYRSITRVVTADKGTYYKNLKSNELLKAVHK